MVAGGGGGMVNFHFFVRQIVYLLQCNIITTGVNDVPIPQNVLIFVSNNNELMEIDIIPSVGLYTIV